MKWLSSTDQCVHSESGFHLCISLLFSLWLCASSTFISQCSSPLSSSTLDSCINYSKGQTQNISQHMGQYFKNWSKSEVLRKGEIYQGRWLPFAKSAASEQTHMAQGFTTQLVTSVIHILADVIDSALSYLFILLVIHAKLFLGHQL